MAWVWIEREAADRNIVLDSLSWLRQMDYLATKPGCVLYSALSPYSN